MLYSNLGVLAVMLPRNCEIVWIFLACVWRHCEGGDVVRTRKRARYWRCKTGWIVAIQIIQEYTRYDVYIIYIK
jgi:hypothetical protein